MLPDGIHPVFAYVLLDKASNCLAAHALEVRLGKTTHPAHGPTETRGVPTCSRSMSFKLAGRLAWRSEIEILICHGRDQFVSKNFVESPYQARQTLPLHFVQRFRGELLPPTIQELVKLGTSSKTHKPGHALGWGALDLLDKAKSESSIIPLPEDGLPCPSVIYMVPKVLAQENYRFELVHVRTDLTWMVTGWGRPLP